MPAARKTTTQRGLGWSHQQQRRRLIAGHTDGTPCPCYPEDACGAACPCRAAGHGLPMYRDPARNPDGAMLEADHSVSRAQGGRRADRLMLATCNRSRGDGTRSPTLGAQRWWTRDWTGDGQPIRA
jgi:hypothetical protein